MLNELERIVILNMCQDMIDLAKNYKIAATLIQNLNITLYKNGYYCGIIFYVKCKFEIVYTQDNNWTSAKVSIFNPEWLNEIKSHMIQLGT